MFGGLRRALEYDGRVRALLLASLVFLVAGCSSSSDRRIASSGAAPTPTVGPVPGDAAAELAAAPADAAVLPDAPVDAAEGHFASLIGTEAIADGLSMKDGEPCDGYELGADRVARSVPRESARGSAAPASARPRAAGA